jgi:zinc transport system substrate-binding protein
MLYYNIKRLMILQERMLPMHRSIILLIGLVLMSIVSGRSGLAAEPPVAMASIGPLHALLTQVTHGVSKSEVLLPPGASPHHFALRPSDMLRLQEADVLFWVGPALEEALVNPIQALGANIHTVEVMNGNELPLLPRREAGVLNAGGMGAPVSGEPDPHIWLDPQLAGMIMGTMADELAKIDPAHASKYLENAIAGQQAMEALIIAASAYLKPIKDRPYVVYHDAYQYFENRFGLHPMAIVSIDSDYAPSAKRVHEIRELVRANAGVCIFVEPQFTPKIVETLRKGTDTRVGILNPTIVKGSDGLVAYERMIWQLAHRIGQCFA